MYACVHCIYGRYQCSPNSGSNAALKKNFPCLCMCACLYVCFISTYTYRYVYMCAPILVQLHMSAVGMEMLRNPYNCIHAPSAAATTSERTHIFAHVGWQAYSIYLYVLMYIYVCMCSLVLYKTQVQAEEHYLEN